MNSFSFSSNSSKNSFFSIKILYPFLLSSFTIKLKGMKAKYSEG